MKFNPKNIKAIIFDLDNTLYDEKLYIESALMNVARAFCLERDLNEQDVFNYLKNDWIKNGERELFQRLLARYQIVINEKNIKQLVTAYRNCKASLVPYSDVIETLCLLKSKGFKLGIITNGGKATQQNKINLLGIKHYFDTIIISGEWFSKDLWKPNKAPFYLCFKKLGVKPNECLYVGDKFDKDIVGASEAGAIPILIDRDESNNTYIYECFKNTEYILVHNFEQIVDLCCERSKALNYE